MDTLVDQSKAIGCAFGRIGWTYTHDPIRYPEPGQFFALVSTTRRFKDTKFVIEPDCAKGAETACMATIPGTITGKFTYPADIDWVQVPFLPWNLNITPNPARPGCFVTAKLIQLDGLRYAVFVGGPSGCGYTATIARRPD